MPDGPGPADRALSLISSIADAAPGCAFGDEMAARLLAAIHRSGLITAGSIEFPGHPPVRACIDAAGEATRARSQPPDAPRGEEPGPQTAPPAEHPLEIAIPTASAPAGTLRLTLADAATAGVWPAIAAQIALAFDRAFLVEEADRYRLQAERRVNELGTVYEIGRAIGTTDNARLLEIVTERAARLMDAQACSLMRLSPETSKLTIAASYGLSEDVVFVTERALGEGIAGHVAQTGEPLVIRDGQDDPRLQGVSLRPEIGSSMIVPMRDEVGRVTGVLSIRRRHPSSDFTDEDLRLFSVFAGQAALAISNNQLYSDLRNRVKQLSTLSDLTQVVISTLDIERLLGSVADSLIDVVRFDRCAIFLMDRKSRRLTPRIVRGYRPEVIGQTPVRFGEGVIGLVAKKQMPIVENYARNALQPLRGFARALGAASFVAVPIIAKGQTIGVVLADNKRSRRTVTPENVDLLTTFVNQAGLAIEHAQLYEDRELRYQEMNRLATQTDNILRSIAASVVVLDADGCVTRWNKASEEMWNITEDAVTGKPYLQIVRESGLPAEESESIDRLLRLVQESGRPHQAHKITLHPPQREETVFNVLISPLVDRSGARLGVVQVMEDVTREATMESEMARIRRLADIGQLAARMAHEVRNPLSSIKGAAQLMRKDYEEFVSLREFLDIIIDEVNGLNRITSDLLDFARPMRLELHEMDLNDLLRRGASLLSSLATDHGVRIQSEFSDDMPLVTADPNQIEQVFRNVLINGIQAMPEGGTVTISTTADHAAGTVAFCVRDEGMGIAEARLVEIFQPFHTTKTKGSGLGLCIAAKIAGNHGGRIVVESAVGQGSAFTVTLPVQAVSATPPFQPMPTSTDLLAGGLPDI